MKNFFNKLSYQHMCVGYYKIMFIILTHFNYFPIIMIYDYSVNIDNNNINLICFTLKTLRYSDLNSLLLLFNSKGTSSVSHYLDEDDIYSNYINIFDSKGKMIISIGFDIQILNSLYHKLAFNLFVASIMNNILRDYAYYIMINNVSFGATDDLYIHISNKNLLD